MPETLTFTYQGDGDLAAIGLAETMSAANRGENFTVIFINNGTYGMTGGQGVMVIGQLLAYTAFETTDKKVTYFPSHGAEQRGGTANCFVVISDQDIGAPKVNMADYLVVLNQPSMERFSESVKNGGALFVNSSIVTDIPQYRDIDIVPVEAGNIAAELGTPKVMNLVMTGAVIGYSDLLPADNVLQTAFRKLGAKRPELNPLNEAAFKRGLEIGKLAKSRRMQALF